MLKNVGNLRFSVKRESVVIVCYLLLIIFAGKILLIFYVKQ